ncbi:putative tetratricopeptide-like helical domain-containing protein [Rosa chinensis]|uniref:Putative tetratricopeptide-like helical domain-containing protein n=1 Tax=Rosa chinensis TaxID=74649 RepID=A0A2P6R7S0_ROSCH|nr:putative tetratricopeptide-like helical domain-containing protein [Rosa chinensis]
MVDLLGRAGQVKEAMDLIEKMPVEADAIVWGALLGACRTHMKLDLAEVAGKKLIQLEPHNAGHYVLLSNMYASKGRWHEVADLRKMMEPEILPSHLAVAGLRWNIKYICLLGERPQATQSM